MFTAIRQWVIKTMMKGQTGVVQTLPKKEIIEMNVQITAERMLRNGVNPNDLKTVGQVENVVNQIDQPRVIPADSAEGKAITEKILGRKKADVLDMEGNKISEGSKIIGGKQIKPIDELEDYNPTSIDQENFLSRVNKAVQENRESDAAIKARLDANNQKGIGNLETNNFALNTITKIKSLSPMDAMKEANLVAGKKGRYSNLNDKQVKKIIDDTNDHIFERDIPIDPEDMAQGGRAGFKGGLGKGFLEFMKKFKVKQSGDGVNEFLSKRKFLQSMVGETEKNKKARQLAELKEAMEEARKNPGFKFKDIDVDKDIRPIFDQSKDRTLNAEGGRIGYADGTPSFEEYLKERGMIEKRENLERLKREFKEDMRRKNVMEQKQMAADGGRIGLKGGMTKRAFMKLMGGFGATVGAAKSGIFTGFGKGATKQVAKEVAQQTTSSTPPPYFFKLAEKIKMMGDDVTATTDRTIAKKLPSKDGKSEYLLEQDVSTGDTSIKKIYKEDDNMITDVEIMEFRKGEDVITKDGKAIKTPDEYEEVTEVNKRIYKDDYNASDYTDGINVDEIIKEVDDQAPPIKYASGGLAYMLGE